MDAVKLRSVGDQVLRITIAQGKGKMPAFGRLSSAEVDDLVAFLRSS